jgi:hypothetical protein
MKPNTLKTYGLIITLGSLLSLPHATAADLEADAFPEFDIWINLDDAGKNRLYILAAFAEEPNFEYNESALGISWDQRVNPCWSWRAGIRYIEKQVNPPDKNETRAVFDLKWFRPIGEGLMFTNRNRIDLRNFDGEDTLSWRYRNRSQLEKPFTIFDHTITGFVSYEMYYDSRYNRWGQRHRYIAGVSVPIKEWLSVDVFYGYHIESKPKYQTGGAVGIAIGLYF